MTGDLAEASAALDRDGFVILERRLEQGAVTDAPGAQFSLTQATQIHPGQAAQPLHYEQGIYPIPRDGDVMVTAIWALDDFTAENGGTLVVPGSHAASAARPASHKVMSIEMPAGSVLVFRDRLWHAGGSNTTNNQGWASSSTTHNRGCAPAKRTLSPSTCKAREAYHSDSKNSLALTRRRPT